MLSDIDKEWILKKLRKFHKTQDVEWEYELMEYGIQHDKPSNLRAYIERYLKKQDYENKISLLGSEAMSMKTPNIKRLLELEKELDKLVAELKKKEPEFYEEMGRQIAFNRIQIRNKITGREVEI